MKKLKSLLDKIAILSYNIYITHRRLNIMKDNRKVYRYAYGMLRITRTSDVDGECLELGIAPYFNNKE